MTLFVGLEGVSEDALRSVDKYRDRKASVRLFEDTIRRVQSRGIGVLGAFILGFDTDDASVFGRVVEFVARNNVYSSQITILTPLPGTPLRDRLLKEDRVLPTAWENYTFTDANFVPRNMSVRQLEEGIVSTYEAIYSPEAMEKRLSHFKRLYAGRV